MKIKADLTVGAKDFKRRLLNFDRAMRTELVRATYASGKLLEEGAKGTFGSWLLGPNAPGYRQWKAEQGYDTRPLLRTHIMRNSVKYVRKQFNSTVILGQVGIPKGLRYPGNLKRGTYKGPGRRNRKLGRPKAGMRSRYDSVYVSHAAYWNEKGIGRPERPVFEIARRKKERHVWKAFRDGMRAALRRTF